MCLVFATATKLLQCRVLPNRKLLVSEKHQCPLEASYVALLMYIAIKYSAPMFSSYTFDD